MEKNTTKIITRTAIVAALYVTLTLSLSWLSYGAIQFRVAEILVLLVFIDKRYSWGLIIGCAISNMFSPLGIVDVIAGTLATAIALQFIVFTRKRMGNSYLSLMLSSLGPVLSNAIIVGLELTILFKELPFIVNAMYVAIGEFVVVSIVGILIFSRIRYAIPTME